MKTRRTFLLSGAALVIAAGLGAAYEGYTLSDLRLSQEPVRVSRAMKLPSRNSVLALRADIPLSVIQTAAAQAIPAEYHFGGNGPDVGGTINPGGWNVIRISVKAGTHYEGTVRRTGDLKISGAGDSLVLELPIQVDGKGGLRGDGARMLGLNAKNFKAGVIVRARMTLGINADWTPDVKIVPEIQWTENPKVEIASRAWVDIRSQVEGPLQAALEGMAAKIRSAIPADIVKRQAKQVWKTYSFQIDLGSGLIGWAHLAPRRIGISGLTVEKDQVRLALSLTADTEFTTNPTASVSTPPLPEVSGADVSQGHLNIATIIRVDYVSLQRLLVAQVVNKRFSAEISGASLEIIVNDIKIYPAAEGLAIAVSFEAHTPATFFDSKGTVYLTGRPVVENGGTLLGLTDVTFTRKLDNELWNLATVVFEDEIRRAIEKAGRIDLAPEMAKQAQAISRAIADPSKTGGVKITIRDLKATVATIIPETDALATLILLDLGIDSELQALNLSNVR